MCAEPASQKFSSTKRENEHLQGIFIAALVGSLSVIAVVGFAAFCWEATYANGSLELPTLFGLYGELLSGVLGPLLSLMSIYFVVVTLREQRETALAERQGEDLEAFENRYYQMLRLHRENVAEMRIGEKVIGRAVFVEILYEFQIALHLIHEAVHEFSIDKTFLEQLELAYYCVFFGIGGNSSSSLRGALKSARRDVSEDFFRFLESKFSHSGSHGKGYLHFEGHQSRLGHYYRHLYQIVSFIDHQDVGIAKHAYVKTVRAQLSTHEQALLLMNSLTGIGWDWWNDGYIEKYGMVKNIPKGFVETYYELAAEELFPAGYFEWQQSKGKPEVLDKVRREDSKLSREGFQ